MKGNYPVRTSKTFVTSEFWAFGGGVGYTSRQMADDKKTVRVEDLKVVDVDGVRPRYCNFAGVNMTNWDIRMLFSEIVVYGDRAQVEPRANIVMTPAHAKAFLGVLARTIERWEKDNGEIKWQKGEGDGGSTPKLKQ